MWGLGGRYKVWTLLLFCFFISHFGSKLGQPTILGMSFTHKLDRVYTVCSEHMGVCGLVGVRQVRVSSNQNRIQQVLKFQPMESHISKNYSGSFRSELICIIFNYLFFVRAFFFVLHHNILLFLPHPDTGRIFSQLQKCFPYSE